MSQYTVKNGAIMLASEAKKVAAKADAERADAIKKAAPQKEKSESK